MWLVLSPPIILNQAQNTRISCMAHGLMAGRCLKLELPFWPGMLAPMLNANPAPYNRGVVRPVECLTSGFEMIKGQYWLILGITVVGILIGAMVPLGVLMGR